MSEDYPRYRWFVLIAAWAVFVTLFAAWFLMPSMKGKIEGIYGISSSQYSIIFTSPYLIAGLGCIFGGMLGDRYGTRAVISVGAFLAGGVAIVRIFMSGFWGLLVPTMFFGVSLAFLLPNLPKIVSVWFPPGEGGVASGIYVTGLGLGMTVGLFSGGLFSSWDQASLVFGLLALVCAVIWTVFGRTSPEGEELARPPVLEGVSNGVRSKSIIGGAVGLFFFIGGLTAFIHLLPHALNSTYGRSMASGGMMASMITLGLVIGNVSLPWLSDKIKKVNILIIIGGVLGGLLFFTGWIVGGSIIAWIVFILGGIFAGAIPPLIFEVPAELPHLPEERIEKEHVAGASGIMHSLQNFGGFIIPAYVLPPISALFGYEVFFLVSSIFLGIPAIATLLIKETGGIEA